ncbi:Exonuclease RNase T and DNA polymerase III [Arcobacter nitrofigilis DSM 7299]|uniref:Exonuclease RNase T and DNA polymerase III n=1 Tax=Arcobacter nitrofigilis (strain ATCC 33309 / DSM 7299 / CCUG 15893 / LMG 7604 / NCTC 12251 / CI) TaxID=572480 RepID=D5V0V6_ARCNC|nr:3'-5' exonuclease [Arcobacter nitrofigilis]ADG93918.1 Exonuclease RNase T and DNA polymerase III [Arcobacter nitrofigilis DSM 7299]
MIILDFETNSHNEHDVIEAAAVKLELVNGEYVVCDKFHRYYLSRYPVNPYSYEVHKLTPEAILKIRQNSSYASYFKEDEDFVEFCSGVETLVAHNISFELRHLRQIVNFKNHICTMKENKHIVKALNKNAKIKNPTLDEVCFYYGIEFDENKHHSATYDVSKTFEILKRMKLN